MLLIHIGCIYLEGILYFCGFLLPFACIVSSEPKSIVALLKSTRGYDEILNEHAVFPIETHVWRVPQLDFQTLCISNVGVLRLSKFTGRLYNCCQDVLYLFAQT